MSEELIWWFNNNICLDGIGKPPASRPNISMIGYCWIRYPNTEDGRAVLASDIKRYLNADTWYHKDNPTYRGYNLKPDIYLVIKQLEKEGIIINVPRSLEDDIHDSFLWEESVKRRRGLFKFLHKILRKKEKPPKRHVYITSIKSYADAVREIQDYLQHGGIPTQSIREVVYQASKMGLCEPTGTTLLPYSTGMTKFNPEDELEFRITLSSVPMELL